MGLLAHSTHGLYDGAMYRAMIKEGKEKALRRHHPWVFSGAIASVEPAFTEAGWAEAVTESGAFIAYGWYDEKSHIILRLMSWDRKRTPGDGMIRSLVREAVERRKSFFSLPDTTAFRLIHGEADFIPGLAVDAYGRELRAIVSSRFADMHLGVIAEELDSLLHPDIIEAVTDKQFAGLEGLPERIRHFRGGKETREDESRSSVRFIERGIWYEAAPGKGQKSGFYCDQRDSRSIAEEYAAGRTVLDLFSYTGGFTLHLLRGGALSVDAVDSSESALRHLLYQIHLNEEKKVLPPGSREKVTTTAANAFEHIRQAEDGKYDMMILDPPKLAKTKSSLENAMKAYKDLNRVAMMKIRNGGIIATFSCSGAMTREDFRMMLAWAAADAGAEIQILRTLSAGEDHPVRLSFPESEYLKGYIIRVIR